MSHGDNPFDDILAPQPRHVTPTIADNPFIDDTPNLLDVGASSSGHTRGQGSRDESKHGLSLDPFFDE